MTARRLLPAALAAACVMLLGLLYVSGGGHLYMQLLTVWGAAPFRFPFVDAHAVLSAIECHRRGIDVYAENPCDVLGRIHVYSPLWLVGSVLPVTTAWTPIAGLASVTLFLLSLTALPPGRDWRQTAIIVLGTLSSTVALAIERANIDIIVFVLTVLGARLLQRSPGVRLLGYGVVLLAGMLKFYPAALMLLAVRERLRTFLAVSLVSCFVGAAFVAAFAHDLVRVLPLIPTWSCFASMGFGARDLPCGLGDIFHWPRGAASAVLIGLAAAMVAYASVLSRRGDLRTRIAALSELETTFLLAGCVLALATFLTAQNGMYRGVHLLLVLPGLTATACGPGKRANRPLVAGCGLVIVLMWGGSVYLATDALLRWLGLGAHMAELDFLAWLLREAMWWAAATMLCTLLIALLSRSPVVMELQNAVLLRPFARTPAARG